jgi:hypothetical protein
MTFPCGVWWRTVPPSPQSTWPSHCPSREGEPQPAASDHQLIADQSDVDGQEDREHVREQRARTDQIAIGIVRDDPDMAVHDAEQALDQALGRIGGAGRHD